LFIAFSEVAKRFRLTGAKKLNHKKSAQSERNHSFAADQ
jgi:hypothetical protein